VSFNSTCCRLHASAVIAFGANPAADGNSVDGNSVDT
jgi:hypothetical protein